jgi:flagellar basal-body rod protein FlgF
MDNTTYIALSRQQALWNHLEVVANNLANVNTTGFKGTDTLFAQYVFNVNQNDRTFKDKVAFTHDFGQIRNLSQGSFNFTGNTYDLSLQGEGYFVTQGDQGQPERYTRAGNFTVNGDGQLVTQEGRAVLSTNGAPITIPTSAGTVVVQGDGSIVDKDGATIDKLRIVRFDKEQDLKLISGTSFVTAAGQRVIDMDKPKVAQGVLEDSNVNGVVEMTRLISINRAYNDVSRLVEEEHERKRKASDLFSRQATA